MCIIISNQIAAFSTVESLLGGKTVVKSQVTHKNHMSDSLQAAAVTHSVPSSNYSSRTTQIIAPQKGSGFTKFHACRFISKYSVFWLVACIEKIVNPFVFNNENESF